MTPRQKQMLDAIDNYWRENGFAPSYAELLEIMKLSSKSAVHSLVKALSERGHLIVKDGKARSMVSVRMADEMKMPKSARTLTDSGRKVVNW